MLQALIHICNTMLITCTICKETKEEFYFKKDPRYSDGHKHQCKKCINKRNNNNRRERRVSNPKVIFHIGTLLPNIIPGFKSCTKCLMVKSLSDFNKESWIFSGAGGAL